MKIIILIFLFSITLSDAFSQLIIGAGTSLAGKRIDDLYINPSIAYRSGMNEYVITLDYYNDEYATASMYGIKFKRWFETKSYPLYLQAGIIKAYDKEVGVSLEVGAGKSFKYYSISPNISYFYSNTFDKLNLGIGISFPLKL